MIRSALLYTAIVICVYVIYAQATYFVDYFADLFEGTDNPRRGEYLGGILLIGWLSLIIWAPLIFASACSRRLSRTERILGLGTGSLVAITTFGSVVVDVFT